MGTRSFGDYQKLVLILRVMIALFPCHTVIAGSCKYELCFKEYHRALTAASIVERQPSYKYCSILHSYSDCMNASSRSCRGNLQYHSYSSLISKWNITYNCFHIIMQGSQMEYSHPNTPSEPFHPKHTPVPFECTTYKPTYGSYVHYSFCGLFGDPHLRTFYNELQTCRVKGAWPLIDNVYFAVQVTNNVVIQNSNATATSKITVVIRAHGSCAIEKTYEAHTNFLPLAFVDGSKSGGPGVRIRAEKTGNHVEIILRYISTRIIIRQIGRYLTFAVRMPRELAIQEAEQDDIWELCITGCPEREQIDYKELLAKPDELIPIKGRSKQEIIPKERAIDICKQHNVTDFYFDACIFDLLTTGDSTFSMAAKNAMRDEQSLMSPKQKYKGRTKMQPAFSTPSSIHLQDAFIPENSAPGRPYMVFMFLSFLFSSLRNEMVR